MAELKEGSVIDTHKIITIPDVVNSGKGKLDKDDFKITTGTFTPNLFGQTTAGSFTYGTKEGRYITIGNLVYFTLYLYITDIKTAPVGIMNIGGLPFDATSMTAVNVTRVAGLKFGTSKFVTGTVSGDSDYPNAVYLYNNNREGQFWNVFGGEVNSSFSIVISGFYLK